MTSSSSTLTLDEKRLLKVISEKGLTEIKPKKVGNQIIYEGLEDLQQELGDLKLRDLLESLSIANQLNKKPQSSTIFCPHCNSVSILSRYNCPKCQSYNVKRLQMIEHLFCGYIGSHKEFGHPTDLTCPKCGSHIGNLFDAKTEERVDKKRSIKVIGSSFECEKCGSKFEKPNISHTCERCGATFTYRDAVYEPLFTYEPTFDGVEITISKTLDEPLTKLSNLLLEKGYHVDLDARLEGKSGADQHFDLIASKDKRLIVIDVSLDGDQNDLVSLMGKKMDIDANSIILLDTTASERLASLGKSYGIEVLDGRDDQYLERLTALLEDAGKGRRSERSINPFKRKKEE